MITKFKTIAAVILVAFTFSNTANAQQLNVPAPSPTQTLDQAFGLSNIKIEYSRPGVKNRTVFGDLVPYGNIWRTGANSSTKITFGDTVKVEGNSLNPGTYAFYTIPGKEEWEILFYNDLKLGGNVADYKKSDELFRFKVKSSNVTEKVETFTMNVVEIKPTTAKIELVWENTRVAFNVTTDIDSKIMKNIESALEKDTRPYFSAANYYYENDKDLKKALEWTDITITQNPKWFFAVHLKAKILYKMKDYKGATEAAEKSMAIAKEEKSDDYIRLNEKLIAKIKAEK